MEEERREEKVMTTIDLIYAKVLAGAEVREEEWEEAIKRLPYYDQSLEVDLGVIRSIHQRINKRINSPKEETLVSGAVRVVARRRRESSDINSEVWGVEGEDENIDDYYMGFDIYGKIPDDVEENDIDLMGALFYDKRLSAKSHSPYYGDKSSEASEEIDWIIEENRKIVETYRRLRREGKNPEEARKLALVEIYRGREDSDGLEELPF